MTFGSLFAGIGGFDLGLERAGFECRWQVELNPYCRRILAKHWPNVPRHDDVKTFPFSGTPEQWRVDLISGGFPCQDVSLAGKGEGIDGSRSGLWKEFRRIICELRPRFVFVENTPGLLVRGLGRVLGDLAALGFDSEWESIPSAAFGASQLRERVFILAHRQGERLPADLLAPRPDVRGGDQARWRWNEQFERLGGRLGDHAYPPPFDYEGWSRSPQGDWPAPCVERGVRGATHGVPEGLDRVTALGNAVDPQPVEWIGRRLIEAVNLFAGGAR